MLHKVRMNQVQEFVSERSQQQQADLTTETNNSWVPILSLNI